ncbi:IQ domain-containing protein IQM2 [Coffea eugenioides]|uniref:IQ domain-containing protein IQM2 n=1 Tax=Coffea arabica TaxID=13443 RepID=A0A6P6T442_COFAR|nr:IQ domain-containing protein IQM2-like [Coffea arabica]XP_027185808.1 IQ domain-containing protein IQM2 [Coffea eugenioides]
MGVSFSCLLAAYCDLQDGLDSVIVKSIGFSGDDEKKTPEWSMGISSQDSESKAFLSLDYGNCQSVIDTETEEMGNQSLKQSMATVKVPQLPILDCSNPKHEAAVKLQKVYKSFRTRRKLADCAVLIENSWWKLLDFAELKHSSISFFDLDKHESAISRWSRARTRAAKVGKGLSKNGKAQKLALQHWLEAIDPRHRYGHNLHFYYVKWFHSQSKEPFFYWLDIGEGKEVNLVEKCPRTKLQQQCIKYLGPMERKAYEVAVEDGKLFYKQTGELLDTSDEPKAKWIFVLGTTRTMYVGKKKKGTFQHSSFLAGGAALAAGRIVVENGILKAVWPHSGHYRPTPENFQDFISFLRDNNVDLTDVKLDSVDEDESFGRTTSGHLRNNSSEEDLADKIGLKIEESDVVDSNLERRINSEKGLNKAPAELTQSRPLDCFASKLTNLQIPSKDALVERFKSESELVQLDPNSLPPESPTDGYETAEESSESEKPRPNLSTKELDATKEHSVSEDSILRISPHSGLKPFQLGNKLSCKWSTGAGPRIGCLRDYPSELQSHALEQANLSPRSACILHRTGHHRRPQSSPLCKKEVHFSC